MEKRRRARINQSLNELKNLILEALKKDVSRLIRVLCAESTESTATRFFSCWARLYSWDAFLEKIRKLVGRVNLAIYILVFPYSRLQPWGQLIQSHWRCARFSFQTSCYSKLEKADILEMTVKYLRSLKTSQTTGWFGIEGRNLNNADWVKWLTINKWTFAPIMALYRLCRVWHRSYAECTRITVLYCS